MKHWSADNLTQRTECFDCYDNELDILIAVSQWWQETIEHRDSCILDSLIIDWSAGEDGCSARVNWSYGSDDIDKKIAALASTLTPLEINDDSISGN